MRVFRPISPTCVWAGREVLRRPVEALLLVTALALIIVLSGTALLLTNLAGSTTRRLIEKAPSLVVRKMGFNGWQPIPEEAVQPARSVPGVVEARARVWGVVEGPSELVTVIGNAGEMVESAGVPGIETPPSRGEAVIGEGVGSFKPGEILRLAGAVTMDFKIVGKWPEEAGIGARDLVLLHRDDARRILGLPKGYAGDLAVFVFHEEEEAAIMPELSTAFPWPVRITTRGESKGYFSASFSRNAGVVLVALIPAMFGLALVLYYTVTERTGRAHEIGLLKSMGWTTGDVVRLHLFRSAIICLPAAVLGMVISCCLVLWPGSRWPGYLLFGWEKGATAMSLDSGDAVLVLIEIVSLVVLPFVTASLLPALKNAAADPYYLIEGD